MFEKTLLKYKQRSVAGRCLYLEEKDKKLCTSVANSASHRQSAGGA
jgi:hypothetical protein